MWLIPLGKAASVIYLLFAGLFAYANIFVLVLDYGQYFPLLPVSWTIPWAANRLRKRLFEDVNFNQKDWIYYPCITVGSWGLYIGTMILLNIISVRN